MSERLCNFPGCTNSIEGTKACTLWCPKCRAGMRANVSKRLTGKRARKALFPHANHVYRGSNMDKVDGPRVADVKCKHCFGMPWARCPDRANDGPGLSAKDGHGVPVVENGLCRGCGLPYAPEPVEQMCGGVRSSAGLASDYADMYGIEIKVTGRRG